MNLNKLSKITGIPYNTLREWDKANNWRREILQYLKELKILEQKAIEKVKSIFTLKELKILEQMLFSAEEPPFIEGGEDVKEWLDREIDKFYFYKIDDYFKFTEEEKKSIMYAIREKSKSLCDFEIHTYYEHVLKTAAEEQKKELEKKFGELD